MIVPVGGAGLIAGVSLAVKALRPNAKIVAVEAENVASFSAALEAGKPTQIRMHPTLADGLAIPQVGANAFKIARPLIDQTLTVAEEQIAVAILRLVELEKSVVEGAAATPLAACMSGKLKELAGKRVVLLLCGGNIDPNVLSRVIESGLVADGRLGRFTAVISDRPGGLADLNSFARRHIGANQEEIDAMLRSVGLENLNALIEAAIPKNIRLNRQLDLPEAKSESEALTELRAIAKKNRVTRSFIGAGYYDCITPPVIQRNILENPGWYTAYTPYQAELAQGRLEALLNFQTMITDLTGLEIANASLLDEATAAAEAMALCHAVVPNRKTFFVADNCHPQTIAVVQTRAKPLGITIKIGDYSRFKFDDNIFGALVQYPATDGAIYDYTDFIKGAHDAGALVVVAADILALTLLKPPGEFGADVAVGNTQRFGVQLGFGGPHAAYFATRDQYKRHMPGRLVGVSHDAERRPAYRLALQTREQHIRRDKTTSNICTAQALLAVIASMYPVYHGPKGLRAIAERVHRLNSRLADGLRAIGCTGTRENFFDTVRVEVESSEVNLEHAAKAGCNLRALGPRAVGISFDETTTPRDIELLMSIFRGTAVRDFQDDDLGEPPLRVPQFAIRTSDFLTHPIFNTHDTETEMLRYLKKLESRDLSLTISMIPLASCTMKLK